MSGEGAGLPTASHEAYPSEASQRKPSPRFKKTLVHDRKVTTMLDAMLPHYLTDDGGDDAQQVTQWAEEKARTDKEKRESRGEAERRRGAGALAFNDWTRARKDHVWACRAGPPAVRRERRKRRGKETNGVSDKSEIHTDPGNRLKWPEFPQKGKVRNGGTRLSRTSRFKSLWRRRFNPRIMRKSKDPGPKLWQWNCRGWGGFRPVLVCGLATSRTPGGRIAARTREEIPVIIKDNVKFEWDRHIHRTDVRHFISAAVKKAGKKPVTITKDINAALPARLAECINNERLTLLIEANQPTRMGTSSCRNTCPDLTLVTNVDSAEWRNPAEQLGSYLYSEDDHPYNRLHAKNGQGENHELGPVAKAERRNDEIEPRDKTPDVDTHLLHLCEARRALTKRWKRQRHNRELRKRIQEITNKVEDHPGRLGKQNWYGRCDSLRGNLSTTQTWRLLRALIDPERTKSATSRRVAELIYKCQEDQDHILKRLVERFICLQLREEQMDYSGEENPEFDRPVTVGEFEY
ncbi:hypothetical protein HPB47_014655 [Ixodes persulcatus]|uniref:Uncharacterized protein n=1 Tax=Ixodes persulcatus TaxID=34615 RepID=A0AC60QVJ6_IXOPE|nr:hypothetical protein HPB47_014655 [Ixodes persulcatus]